MIKVLHVRSTIGLYGAERVLLNLQQAFEEIAPDLSEILLISSSEHCELSHALKQSGLSSQVFVSHRKLDLNLVKAIRRQIKENGFCILHSHDYKSLIHSRIAALGTGVKLVHHIHGSLGNTLSERLYAIVESAFMFTSDLVLTVSEEQRKASTKKLLGVRPVSLLPNGTPMTPLNKPPLREGVLNLIMVARFTPEKDHERAIRLIRLAIDKAIPLRLTLLGNGPLFEPMKGLVQELGIEHVVNFVGYTNDVTEWLREADVLLVTSKTEGMPMSVLEAMSLGLPVLSTAVGELPSIVEGSGCGQICKTDEAFLTALTHYSAKASLESESYMAWKFVNHNYSISAQREKLGVLYAKLLGASYDIGRV